MLEKHRTSLMMLLGAILFYVVFGIIVPDVFYGSPESATKPVEHATAATGQVLRSLALYVTIVLAGYGIVRFMKETKK